MSAGVPMSCVESGIVDETICLLSFGEDLDRKRQQNSAQNFSLLNRIALNLLRQDKTTKLGIKGKRLKAGWDNNYLMQLLAI
jgi:hypothetical protein